MSISNIYPLPPRAYEEPTVGFYPPPPEAPSAPLLIESALLVGRYNGKEIYKIIQTGIEYVIYKINTQTDELIALPYHGFHTLRSVQSVAVSILGAAVGLGVGMLSTLTVGWAVVAGLGSAVLVAGIGLAIIWGCNNSDPEAQMENRQRLLDNQVINHQALTTPDEKRQMFFTKNYNNNVKFFMKDFRTLFSQGYLTLAEEGKVPTIFNQLESLNVKLQEEKQAVLDEANQQFALEQRTAWDQYNSDGWVIASRAAHTAQLVTLRDKDNSALLQGGLVAVNIATSAGVAAAVRLRDQRIGEASSKQSESIRHGLARIQYDSRNQKISEATSRGIAQFRGEHSVSGFKLPQHNLRETEKQSIFEAFRV